MKKILKYQYKISNQKRNSSKGISLELLNDTKKLYEKYSIFEIYKSFFLTTSCRFKFVSETGSKLMESDPTKLIQLITKYTYFPQFCGGETLNECSTTIKRLKNRNMGCLLDYSVEGFSSNDPRKETKMVYLFFLKIFQRMKLQMKYLIL
jgi:proline dehydrogenase